MHIVIVLVVIFRFSSGVAMAHYGMVRQELMVEFELLDSFQPDRSESNQDRYSDDSHEEKARYDHEDEHRALLSIFKVGSAGSSIAAAFGKAAVVAVFRLLEADVLGVVNRAVVDAVVHVVLGKAVESFPAASRLPVELFRALLDAAFLVERSDREERHRDTLRMGERRLAGKKDDCSQ